MGEIESGNAQAEERVKAIAHARWLMLFLFLCWTASCGACGRVLDGKLKELITTGGPHSNEPLLARLLTDNAVCF